MSIKIGSKWVKDGEVVEVTGEFLYSGGHEKCIVFLHVNNQERLHILTERDFLEQYKPYEPIYEWEFVAQQPDGVRHFTDFMTKKEMEHFSFQNDCAYYQRLDFTKRERNSTTL